jgi:LPS O-antigen subunit length determinant protein (WzzB/FepE family)
MNNNNILNNKDELDLVQFLKLIWYGKYKIVIITIISLLVGFVYNNYLPFTYINSLTIKPADEAEFIRLTYLNKLLGENIKHNQFKQTNLKKTNDIILNKFIDELTDYEEFINSIRNRQENNFDFSKLSESDQNKILFSYANLLKIDKSKNEKDFVLTLKWENHDEAKDILHNTIDQTLKNLKKSIFKELDDRSEITKKKRFLKDLENLEFLEEQSLIAKELNMEENQNLSNNASEPLIYYLKGYRAIDKEIELIEKRRYQKFDLIEKELNEFKKSEFDLIKYNIFLINKKFSRNPKIIIFISLILGLILGLVYVTISNSFQVQAKSKKIS